MRVRERAQNYAKNKVKKKAKNMLKAMIIKFLIPWGIFIIGIVLIVTIIIGSLQAFAEGNYDGDLSEAQNKILSKHVEEKVKDINAVEPDYFAFDQEHRLRYEQVTSFMSYKNTYTESIPKDSEMLLNYYKGLCNDVIRDLKPKLEYSSDTMKTSKEYSTWIKKWTDYSGITSTSGEKADYIITNDINKVEAEEYEVGTKIYDFNLSKTYMVNEYIKYNRQLQRGAGPSNGSGEIPPPSEILPPSKPEEPNPKPISVKYVAYYSGKPYAFKDIIFVENKDYLPEVDSLEVGKSVYVYSNNKTYVVEEELKEKEESNSEGLRLLTYASTFVNDYKYTYKTETTTVTAVPDGTEEGRVEGEVTLTITKPILDSKEKLAGEDYDNFKKIIKKINKDEDMDFVIAMMKNAKDTKFDWVFGGNSYGGAGSSLFGSDIPQEFIPLFVEAGRVTGLPPGLLAGIGKAESSFNPNAVSNSGLSEHAYGIMQFWEPNWNWQYSQPKFKQYLEENGFKTQSAKQAWELYLNSPKMQIFVGAYEINYYINYQLYYENRISGPTFSPENMSQIDWKHIFSDKQPYETVAKALALYNGGEAGGKDVDIYGSSGMAIYARRVMDNFKGYGSCSEVIDIAMKFLGFPYLWGGYDPSQGGMDCSGFMQYIHKQIGIDITRTTYSQIEFSGFNTVSVSEMQTGDLIYFSYNGESVEHVGMYLGDGRFIEASGDEHDTSVSVANSRGHKIKITEYNSYWQSVTHSVKRLK